MARSRPELFEDARQDYILKQGKSGVKNELIKAYLLSKGSRVSANSNLLQRTLDLETEEARIQKNNLLESRVLAGKVVDVERDQNESKYSISQLAEVVAHPYLNSDLVMEMDEAERLEKVRELEAFYGVAVPEILAFLEFKRMEKKTREFQQEGKRRLSKRSLTEEEREQLRDYESKSFGQFFQPRNVETMPPKQSMIEFAEANEADSAKQEPEPTQPILEKDEIIPEDDPRLVKFAPPSRIASRQNYKLDTNYSIIPNLPEKYRVRNRFLQPYIRPELYLPAPHQKQMKDFKISELLDMIKNDQLSTLERLQIMRTIYFKQSDNDMNAQLQEFRVFNEKKGVYTRRSHDWMFQEEVRRRVKDESAGLAAVDLMQGKGAFQQLGKFQVGVNLPEQSVLGTLNFAETKEEDRVKEGRFRRLLKRRVEEYVFESGFDAFEDRKEVFLALEKGIRTRELPDLSEKTLLGLIMHPWSLQYLFVLNQEHFFEHFSLSSSESLGIFIDFFRQLPDKEKPLLSEFFQLFRIDDSCRETFQKASELWRENASLQMNPVWLARLLLNLQIQNKWEPDLKLLESLRHIRVQQGDQTSREIFSAEQIGEILACEEKSLFFAELLLNRNPADALRLVNLGWAALQNMENQERLLGLFVRQISTFDTKTLKKVFVNTIEDKQSRIILQRVLDKVENLKSKLENKGEDEMQYVAPSDDFNAFSKSSSLFVKYRNQLPQYNKRSVLKEGKEYQKFQSLIESAPLEKSLEEYNRLRALYETQTKYRLPPVLGAENSINRDTLQKNLQIVWDFYRNSMQSKISKEDATFTEQRKSAFFKNKLSRQKGLNFLNRTVRFHFSEKEEKEESEDFLADLNNMVNEIHEHNEAKEAEKRKLREAELNQDDISLEFRRWVFMFRAD